MRRHSLLIPLFFAVFLVASATAHDITVETNIYFRSASSTSFISFSSSQTFAGINRAGGYWYFDDLGLQVNDANMTVANMPPNTLIFTVTADVGATSISRIYCGSLGQPHGITGATSYSYNEGNQTETITVLHTNSVRVTLDWKIPEKSPTSSPLPNFPASPTFPISPHLPTWVDGAIINPFSILFLNGSAFLGFFWIFISLAALLVALALTDTVYTRFVKKTS